MTIKMNLLQQNKRNKGVSDVVSWILVFAVIASGVALIFTFGATELNQAQLQEQDNNIERALVIFYSNNSNVVEDIAPSRSTEIDLYDSEIQIVENTTRARYSVPSEDIQFTNVSDTVKIESGSADFQYEMHSIHRTNTQQSQQPFYVREPNIVQYSEDSDAIRLQMVSLDNIGSTSGVQGGIRSIETNTIDRDVERIETTEQTRVRLEFENETNLEAQLLEKHLEQQDGIEGCSVTENRVSCMTESVTQITISQVNIGIRII